MKAGEEIDALRALGVDIIDHLVLPRILALVLVAPLVMAYAALAARLHGGIGQLHPRAGKGHGSRVR